MADGAPDLDLARLARGEDGAGVEVDDAQLHVADGQAGRVETPGLGSVDRVGGDHRHLAGPVGRQPAHARPRRDRLGHRRRHRGRAPHDVAQRRQVVAPRGRGGWPGPARSGRPPSRASSARPRCSAAPRRGRSAGAAGPWRRPTRRPAGSAARGCATAAWPPGSGRRGRARAPGTSAPSPARWSRGCGAPPWAGRWCRS